MIGIFDSGSGGLSVLEALLQRLPERDFLYLGDHARAPYGERGSEEVFAFTREAVDSLLDRGCHLVIIACNTAAAVALRRLQQQWLPQRAPEARVLGVHVPLVEVITGARWSAPPTPRRRKRPRTVAILATPRTVASGAFTAEITRRAAEITVLEQACPGLADAIEADAKGPILQDLVDRFVSELMDRDGADELDVAALACTHYPFVADRFAAALPRGVDVLTQPAMVADALDDYLARHPYRDRPGRGCTRLLTTGDPERLNGLAARLPAALRRFESTKLETQASVSPAAPPPSIACK